MQIILYALYFKYLKSPIWGKKQEYLLNLVSLLYSLSQIMVSQPTQFLKLKPQRDLPLFTLLHVTHPIWTLFPEMSRKFPPICHC